MLIRVHGNGSKKGGVPRKGWDDDKIGAFEAHLRKLGKKV